MAPSAGNKDNCILLTPELQSDLVIEMLLNSVNALKSVELSYEWLDSKVTINTASAYHIWASILDSFGFEKKQQQKTPQPQSAFIMIISTFTFIFTHIVSHLLQFGVNCGTIYKIKAHLSLVLAEQKLKVMNTFQSSNPEIYSGSLRNI